MTTEQVAELPSNGSDGCEGDLSKSGYRLQKCPNVCILTHRLFLEEHCICPRAVVCADTVQAMVFLTIARVTAW